MPIKFIYNNEQPHHATYRNGDESFDLIAGAGDVVEIPEAIAQTSSIINLVKIGVLTEVEEVTKPTKLSKPAKPESDNNI